MKPFQSIFYLDDDIDDLHIFKNIVESLGHSVSTFMNGHQMLNMLDTQREKPDVIFLDIHMPILNGQEILNVIKNSEDWKHIPVIMVSGAYPKKLVRHFMEVGANHLIKKTHTQDFKIAIEEALNMDFYNVKAVS